jgi:hypothetical protein
MQTFKPHRRKLLCFGATSLVAATTGTLSGCASRGPHEPEPPPKPLKLLSMLPVESKVAVESSGFGGPRYPGTTVIYVPTPRGSYNAGAAIGAGLLIAGIGYAVQESRRKERERLMAALAEVAFDPIAQFQQRVPQLLSQRGVALVKPSDAPKGDAPKDETTTSQAAKPDAPAEPAEPDARLTLSILDQGYYLSSGKGGYSPMLYVLAELHETTGKNELIDSYYYYADLRSKPGDPRWVTTPPEITFDSVEQLQANAAAARAGLQRVVERMSEMIATDVGRRARGEHPIDY